MLSLILHSNLFNFAIFLLIIILIAKKVDISSILDKMRNEVISKIDISNKNKAEALTALSAAQLSADKTQSEIDEIMYNARTTSETMKLHIIEEANIKVQNIAKNSKNIIANEEKQAESALISELGKKSVELAQNYIIEELNKNPDLHKKFIEESLDELDEVML